MKQWHAENQLYNIVQRKAPEVPFAVCQKPCEGHNKHVEEGTLVG